jgi:serralysin
MAYGAKYLGGVSLAAGDVNGDGVDDIVTVPSVGAAQVHVYESHVLAGGGFVLTRNFNAFADHPGLSTRATIAVGDIDGARDGNSRADIVVAAGIGSLGRIRVFDVTTNQSRYTPIRQIAYPNPNYWVVHSIALGDVNGDGYLDIVTGSGPGGSGMVRIYNGNPAGGNQPISSFRAFPAQRSTAALHVAAKDVDGSGKAEVLAAFGSGTIPKYQVKRFRAIPSQLVDIVHETDSDFHGFSSLNIA